METIIVEKQKSEEQLELLIRSVKELLSDETIGNLCVTFTKKDGSERKMYCTLAPKFIPEEKHPKTDTKFTEEAIRVFDKEIGDWRSFRWDSVTSFSYSKP